jgi:hypothetical protein
MIGAAPVAPNHAPARAPLEGSRVWIYAQSFEGPAHLDAILREARGIGNDALAGGGA